MSVTIKDVALLANTSISTVSKVLNNRTLRITAEKRAEIQKLAKKLHYFPNRTAIQLKKGRTDTVSIVVPDLLNSFYPRLIKQCIHEFGQRCFDTVIYDSDYNTVYEIKYICTLQTKAVDGSVLILSRQNMNEKYAAELQEVIEAVNLPIVLVNTYVPNISVSSVSTDQKKEGYIATKHLLELGHSRIAYIAEAMNVHAFSRIFAGYQTALEEANVPVIQDYILQGYCRQIGGYKAGKLLMKTDTTAIVAENDQLAIGAMRALLESGLSIPEDISVVGIDDILLASIFEVPLTTVKQSTEDLAAHCTRILTYEIECRNCGKSFEKTIVELEPELIIRKSTTSPRNRYVWV